MHFASGTSIVQRELSLDVLVITVVKKKYFQNSSKIVANIGRQVDTQCICILNNEFETVFDTKQN